MTILLNDQNRSDYQHNSNVLLERWFLQHLGILQLAFAPSVAAVVKAHTTHLWNACFNCFSRGAEFLEFTHRLNESCHVYVYELMLRWQNVKLGRHHRQRREGGGVGFFQSVSQIASHTHRMCFLFSRIFPWVEFEGNFKLCFFSKIHGPKNKFSEIDLREITCFFFVLILPFDLCRMFQYVIWSYSQVRRPQNWRTTIAMITDVQRRRKLGKLAESKEAESYFVLLICSHSAQPQLSAILIRCPPAWWGWGWKLANWLE